MYTYEIFVLETNFFIFNENCCVLLSTYMRLIPNFSNSSNIYYRIRRLSGMLPIVWSLATTWSTSSMGNQCRPHWTRLGTLYSLYSLKPGIPRTVEREELLYPSSSLIAETRGCLDLLLGISFMTIWDGAIWLREFIAWSLGPNLYVEFVHLDLRDAVTNYLPDFFR